MSITATQQAASITTAAGSGASAPTGRPAHTDLALVPAPMPMPMPMPMPIPGPVPPYYNPFDQIRNLLDQLRMAIEQLVQPPFGDIYPPDPYQHGCGMNHGIPTPVDPIQSRPRPIKGDAVGSIYTKSSGRTSITVSSVHRTFQDRNSAIAEAKRLASSKGNAIHGVVANHARGTFTVVGLNSSVPISPQSMGSVAGRDSNGLILDAIAFDGKTARKITSIEATPGPVVDATMPPRVPAPDEHAH